MYKKYSKECLWCGKLFETNRQDKLCCNHVCSSKRNKEVSKSWYEKERVRWIKKPPAFFTNATDKIKEIKRRYQVYQHSAKRRRRRFNLTIEEFKGFIIGECCYCGAQANSFNGIDRVDSSIGYVKRNCVSCCAKCNRMKLDMTVKEFAEHIIKLQKWAKSEVEKETNQ